MATSRLRSGAAFVLAVLVLGVWFVRLLTREWRKEVGIHVEAPGWTLEGATVSERRVPVERRSSSWVIDGHSGRLLLDLSDGTRSVRVECPAVGDSMPRVVVRRDLSCVAPWWGLAVPW